MDSKIFAIIAPVLSSIVTFVLTSLHHRRERKSDLETKLTKRIQDLTEQIIDLNQKYLETIWEVRRLKKENEELKEKLEEIVLKKEL